MTRPSLGALGCLVLLGMPAAGAADEPSSSCPATVAASRAFAEPSPSSASRFWHGSEALAVRLNRSGIWGGMPSRNYRNKLWWWRQGYVGATEPRPELVVSGRRLDGDAPPATV